MRVDKFLKISRILKRRTVAKHACEGNRVKANGKDVKPSYEVKVGDIIEIGFGSGTLKFEVLKIQEYVKKEDAESLYKVIN